MSTGDFDPPAEVRITGTREQLQELPSVVGLILDDHGQRLLDDDRGSVVGAVLSDAVITAIRALGLQVDVLATSEQVIARQEQIAAEQGDAVTVTGDVLVAFHPPEVDPVPDDFTLTLTPSTGTPIGFEKGDATDEGDGLLSFTLTDPPRGVTYAAHATLEVGGEEIVVFEGFELHQLLLELVQPDRKPTIPPIVDPLAFATDPTPDPDGDSLLEDQMDAEADRQADFDEAGKNIAEP
jgi:hypothetical protein